jgi:4-methylaminobutanoate oxidase (formaldehyde-forming)
MPALPTHAEIIVIGGGIIGCSTAYHLAKAGAKDVVLLERHKLTSGTSFHAAGLVGQLRTSASVTKLLKYSVELYRTLEAETGQATGWKMNGGLRLACNEERMTEIKRQATTAHSFGLDMHLLSPKEAQNLWPLMDIDDLVGAAFLPTDGQANPSDITLSLAKGARMRGVEIVEGVEITGLRLKDGRITGVEIGEHLIGCEKLVICAGQWSKEIGRMAGISVPVQSVEHQYIVTEACGAPRDLPTLRDPDRLIYYKEEVGGLVMGGYEPNPIAWAVDGFPKNFHFSLLDNRIDHFEQIMEQALIRTPLLEKAGIKQFINGPEAFTPDGTFMLGEAPETKNIFVGCGFNAFGIASAGGAGMALAEWVIGGEPSMDLWTVDIRRFSGIHKDDAYVRNRTLEAYSKHYTMAWPFEEYESVRPLLTSPLYTTLKEQGAVFGQKLGWERPNWFGPKRVQARDVYTYKRQNWFPFVGDEHKATREKVVLFDQTSFAKFEVTGKDAEKALSWIAANDVTKASGRLVYSQMLNARGGIECDVTIARLAEERFFIVTGTGFRTHDADWINRNLPRGLDVAVTDVTERLSCLALMGPRARDVLQSITGDDVSNTALPFAHVRDITIAGVTLRAHRITYVGELGFELYMPVEHAAQVYQALMLAGEKHALRNGGYRAIESLRLEKGYRAWGADITPDSTPLEAGLGFAVKLGKDIDFLGRAALETARKSPQKRMMAIFTADPSVVLLGRETVFRNGQQVGYLSSGGFGYTVNRSIGLGYVGQKDGIGADFVLSGEYELEVACERVPARVALEPLYDPGHLRVRG